MIKALKGRPLCFFCLAFVLLIYLSFSLSSGQKIALGVTAVVITISLIIIYVISKNKYIKRALVIIPITLGIALGSVYGYVFSVSTLSKSESLVGKSGKVTGIIEKVLYENDFSTAYKIRITEIDGKSVNIKALAKFPFGYQADEYDILSFEGSFSSPSHTEDVGFNEKEYCISEGMTVVCNGSNNISEPQENHSLLKRIADTSRSLSAKLRLSLGEYNGGFLSGLLLGRRSEVPDKLSTSFKYLGISHVLSVSGLHLTILIGALYFLLSKTPLPMWVRFVICTVFMLFFVLLTGAEPAVIRSSVMMAMTFAAYLLGRNYDPLTALSLSALVIVFIDPLSVYDASFVLSITASLGIVILGIPACSDISKAVHNKNAMIRTLGAILMSASITVSATLFTMPAVGYYFGSFSAISVLTNLIFVPLCTVLMFLAIIHIITYGTFIAPAISVLTSALASLIDKLSYTISQKVFRPLTLNYDFVIYALIITFAVFVLLKTFRKRGILCVITMSAVFILSYSMGLILYDTSNQIETSVMCVTSSDNDYIIISKNNKTLLCDMSDGGKSPLYALEEISLKHFHSAFPDELILTHLHRKHITMVSFFTDNYRPSSIYLPSPQNKDEEGYANAIKAIAKEKNIKVKYYSSDTDAVIDFYGCKVNIYPKVDIDRSNQPIHLITVKDQKSLIYCGSSINESSLMELLPNLALGESYLWFGTHGPIAKQPLNFPYSPYRAFVSNEDLNEIYCTDYDVISTYQHIVLKKK